MELHKGTRWNLVEAVVAHVSRLLLWGPTGTGKTTLAMEAVSAASANGVFYVQVTDEMLAAEIRGTYVPGAGGKDGRGWHWQDGVVLHAMRKGARLVVDEINLASGDCSSFLIGVCNDPSRVSLPTGEIVTAKAGFQIIATMNDSPDMLSPQLQSRFPVAIELRDIRPEALASLPEDVRAAAAGLAQADNTRRLDIRSWLTFARLRETVGQDAALSACFGVRATAVADVLAMGARTVTDSGEVGDTDDTTDDDE